MTNTQIDEPLPGELQDTYTPEDTLDDNPFPDEDSNLVNFAIDELNDIDKDSVIRNYMNEITDLIRKFSSQGHSGASAAIESQWLVNTIDKLLHFKPLQPIKDEPEYWNEVGPNGLYQHTKDSKVFKDNDGAHHLDGFIWENIADKYDSFTGTVEGIQSSRHISSFPATIPDPVYVKVQKTYVLTKPTGSYCEDTLEDGTKVYYNYSIIDDNFRSKYSDTIIQRGES